MIPKPLATFFAVIFTLCQILNMVYSPLFFILFPACRSRLGVSPLLLSGDPVVCGGLCFLLYLL
jgi:hypothetical protein